MQAVGEAQSRGQVAGLLLLAAVLPLEAGGHIGELADATHVFPVLDGAVVALYQVALMRGGVPLLGLAVAHHHFMPTTQQ